MAKTKRQKRNEKLHPRRPRKPPLKGDQTYRQIHRVVDGAVMEAFKFHPDYLTEKGHMAARESIDKRVTAALKSYLTQAGWVRSGLSPAGDRRDFCEGPRPGRSFANEERNRTLPMSD